ncbi:MAG: hypothetical protein ACQERC_07710 [Bacteroidota bacterium]
MKHLIALFLIGLMHVSTAQISVFNESSYDVDIFESTKGKSIGSSFVGIDEESYIYTLSTRRIYIGIGFLTRKYLKVFNAETGDMHAEVKIAKTKALRKRGVKYVDFRFINEQPTIICKNRRSKSNKYYGIHINNQGQLQGNRFEIGEGADCSGLFNHGGGFFSGVHYEKNDDGTVTFISDLSCSKDEVTLYRVMELDENMDLENSFTFKMSYGGAEITSFIETEDYIYLKATTQVRKKIEGKVFKRTITTHRLFKIEKQDGDITEIELEEKLEPLIIGDFRMKIVPKGILLSGQNIKERGFAGLFTAVMDKRTNDITEVQTEEFDEDFVTRFWSDGEKRRNDKRKNRGKDSDEDNFSTNFKLIETFDTSDDGLISVFQEFELRVSTTTTTGANGQMTTTTVYHYYYKDVIIVKTNKNGSIAYTELLPFYQSTTNYDPGKGYSAVRKNNDIYFLHGTSNEMEDMIEDGKKSRGRTRFKDRRIKYLSITHLSERGDIDTEKVLDLRETSVSTDPNNVATDQKNHQFIIVSPVTKMFRKKRTQMIKIKI